MLIVSCTGNKGYDQLLAKADSLMNVDDDSAKVAIQLLDDVKPELTEFTRSQVMRYELLYHKAMNKADIAFTSDSVMLEVVDYYEHHGSANDRQDKNMNCVSTVLEYVANFFDNSMLYGYQPYRTSFEQTYYELFNRSLDIYGVNINQSLIFIPYVDLKIVK